jgi:hypothetical protein
VKGSAVFALLVLFTVAWIGFSLLDYYLTTQNSDCLYTAIEPCTRFARYEQQIVVWRAVAVQSVAILAALLIRER